MANTNRHPFSRPLPGTLLLTVLTLSLAACEQVNLDDFPGNADEVDLAYGYTLKFIVEQYSLTDFDDAVASRATKEASELGTVLNFAVFQDGEKVKTVNQSNTSSDFGQVSVTLDEGSYEIVVLIHSCSGNATISSPDAIKFPSNKVTDTFAYYAELDVTADASYSITVERVVAMYRMTIEDAIPSDVAQMEFYYTGGSSTLNAVTGYGNVNSRQTEYREVTNWSVGQVFELYTFPHGATDELTMRVTAQTSDEETYLERTFSNVPVEIRKVTNHSCAFFSGTNFGSSAFGISGSDEWEGELSY